MEAITTLEVKQDPTTGEYYPVFNTHGMISCVQDGQPVLIHSRELVYQITCTEDDNERVVAVEFRNSKFEQVHRSAWTALKKAPSLSSEQGKLT